MPQHLADRFQRYALRERNRRGEGMPREVDRGVERQTGVSGNCLLYTSDAADD